MAQLEELKKDEKIFGVNMRYTFVCKNCGHKFEIKLNMAETITNVQCPKCKSTDTIKKYYPPTIHYKYNRNF